MTQAPAPARTREPGTEPVAATVTAVLVLRDAGPWLSEVLDSLARQTRAPERLVVVDAGAGDQALAAVREHPALGKVVVDVRFLRAPADATLGAAVRQALAESPAVSRAPSTGAAAPVEHLWLLTSGSVPDATALARLLDAVRRSPSVALAGPKLLCWDDPGRLESVGIQVTRSGRLIPSPRRGEPDQGQYDRRTDVLAVPFAGSLVERALLEHLGGHEDTFGDFGADLDLAWRANLAGRRVIVVPRATVRARDGDGHEDGRAGDGRQVDGREGDPARRRAARRVALTRCAPALAPLLALWIALSSLLAGVALLAVKRPRAAWAELADLTALLDPWRTIAARWRSRGTRTLHRRDLSGLFVHASHALRHTADLVHDEVGLHSAAPARPRPGAEALETGPVPDEALELHVLSASWPSRVAGNPGVLAVALTTLVTLFAGRDLAGGFAGRLRDGLAGGELVGVRADSATLWHAWLDGWHGAGLGHTGEEGPHLAVLAGLAWLVEHLPGVGPSASPVGTVVATILGLTFPLATATAYLAGRVVTRSRWARARAARAWSSSAVVATSAGAGRLGGAVAAVLLPPVAAGFALAARRQSTTTATAATALGLAVLGAFMPAMAVLGATCALVLLVLGRGRGPRVRALVLLVVPPALLGPWLLELVRSPHRLLAGPGLTVWGSSSAQPWEIALAHPGGPGAHPVLFSAPLVLAGLVGLLRGGRRSAGATALAVLAVAGLALALAAPRIELGSVPDGLPLAGQSITAWPGLGLYPYLLALIAAALLGSERLAVRPSVGGWTAVARWPVAAAVVAAVLASLGWTAWKAVGSDLSAWSDPRPAVAVDQAETAPANRMLLLSTGGRQVSYQLLGREVSGVARDLPLEAGRRSADPALATAVGLLFEQGGSPDSPPPAAELAAQGVGFVGLRAGQADPAIRTLDATAGLSRLGEHQGVLFWRVLPTAATADGVLAPSRARIVGPGGTRAVAVTGDHGATSARLAPGRGASLVVAEPPEWARHARVSYNGRVLAAVPRAAQPTYALPQAPGRLVIDVTPTRSRWRWAQLALLALVTFLALPVGGRGSRRHP